MNKLNTLDAWKDGVSNFFSKSSAQSYMGTNLVAMASNGSCGSSCGAGDKPAQKPSACGAGDDKPAPKPSACGAGDDKPAPKPSACGAGDK